jgi:hypothetical protein
MSAFSLQICSGAVGPGSYHILNVPLPCWGQTSRRVHGGKGSLILTEGLTRTSKMLSLGLRPRRRYFEKLFFKRGDPTIQISVYYLDPLYFRCSIKWENFSSLSGMLSSGKFSGGPQTPVGVEPSSNPTGVLGAILDHWAITLSLKGGCLQAHLMVENLK